MSTLEIPSRYEESDTPKAEWSTKRSFDFVDTEVDNIEEKEDGNSEIRRNMRLETYEANSVRLILEEPSINVDYIMALVQIVPMITDGDILNGMMQSKEKIKQSG
jgi:hypothetical protein